MHGRSTRGKERRVRAWAAHCVVARFRAAAVRLTAPGTVRPPTFRPHPAALAWRNTSRRRSCWWRTMDSVSKC